MKTAQRTARGGLQADTTLALVILPWPGLSPRQERELERELAEYLLERDLIADGTQLHMTVRAEDREIGMREQVDLMHWLLTRTPVCALRVRRQVDNRRPDDSPWIVATHTDRALRPLLKLYGMGRIDGETLVMVLADPITSEGPVFSPHASS